LDSLGGLAVEKKFEYSYRTFAEEDESAVKGLVKAAFPSFLKGDFWVWKYRLNPEFDSNMVVVAERDGRIVGCNHWLVRDLKLSGDLKVKASLGGDVVVSPEDRGHGVGKALLRFFRTSKVFKEKGIILTYMFAEPDLSRRLYRPAVGYVAAPDSTTMYTKSLNCRRIGEKIQLINEAIQSRNELQRELKGLKMRILFRLRGAPAFSVNLASNRVNLDEGDFDSADAIVEGDLPLFSSAIEGKIGVSSLAKAVLTRKLRIKKGKLKILKLFKIFKLFKIALSSNVKP
jgi:predicted N-acetyltransferase YhbS/putative sterol carrier protein